MFEWQKRKQEFKKRYPSYEDFRRAVDESRIRRVKEQDGDVTAIKVLRDDFPGAPLELATRYVREL